MEFLMREWERERATIIFIWMKEKCHLMVDCVLNLGYFIRSIIIAIAALLTNNTSWLPHRTQCTYELDMSDASLRFVSYLYLFKRIYRPFKSVFAQMRAWSLNASLLIRLFFFFQGSIEWIPYIFGYFSANCWKKSCFCSRSRVKICLTADFSVLNSKPILNLLRIKMLSFLSP